MCCRVLSHILLACQASICIAPPEQTSTKVMCTCHMVQVQSIVFANSGTLLLCLVDVTGQLAEMRQKMRQAFPGQLRIQTAFITLIGIESLMIDICRCNSHVCTGFLVSQAQDCAPCIVSASSKTLMQATRCKVSQTQHAIDKCSGVS